MEVTNVENDINTAIPRAIQRLPEDVINRIAAGEVVVRPSAALKELLENSLDAGATSITVSVREGGRKLLQIADNGKGIEFDDLPLLCERFATSKITKFEDLENVQTFGFRGEALSSISHVARISVLTKTLSSPLAHRVSYIDGSMKDKPQPTAGTDGTTITVEDLFYNLVTRRRTLKSSTEEYRAIVDVVARYSIRYPNVAFVCRKHPGGGKNRLSSGTDVRTDGKSTVKETICNAFGSSVANELNPFEVKIPQASAAVYGQFSSANYSSKKGVFILFINGRLIECKPFKRAIWNLYSNYIPKSSFPFVYIDLSMRQNDIDVNVHPAKKEVRFLHEDLIIEAVSQQLNSSLKGAEKSRSFPTQTVLVHAKTDFETTTDLAFNDSEVRANVDEQPSSNDQIENQLPKIINLSDPTDRLAANTTEPVRVENESNTENRHRSTNKPLQGGTRERSYINVPQLRQGLGVRFEKDGIQSTRAPSSGKKVQKYAKDKVRTGDDAPVGLFDKYLNVQKGQSVASRVQPKRRRRENAVPLLTSVQNLLAERRKQSHKGMETVLAEHQFVGPVSDKLVMLQHGTKLLLAEREPLTVQLMYQRSLTHFGDHDIFQLRPPAPIAQLISAYVNILPSDPNIPRINTETCTSILLEKGPMLKEYYGIAITGSSVESAIIEELPMLLPGIIPNVQYLSSFLYNLVLNTDWNEEETCFRGVSTALSEWYGKHWSIVDEGNSATKAENQEDVSKDRSSEIAAEKDKSRNEQEKKDWNLQHIIFDTMRSGFFVPRKFSAENVIREITSTSKLYKIFERC